MAVRPIVLYPDPVLLRPARRVEQVDDDIRSLVDDMVDTMYVAPGVGLAANQIGVDLRVLVVDLTVGERPGELKVFINPEITATDGSQYGEEGCLSFPDITLDVDRANRVTVEAVGYDGEPFTFEGEGLMARAILHEIDHLDGRVFLQRVSSLKREIVKRQIRKRIKTGDWVAATAS